MPYKDDAQLYLDKTNTLFWEQISAQYGPMSLRRVFTWVAPERIQKLALQAQHFSPSYVAPDFLKYYVVDCPPGAHPEKLVKAFREWQIVEHAYVSRPLEVASPVNDTDEMGTRGHYFFQGYLKAAPDGVDAIYVWPKTYGGGFAGGSGCNQSLMDIELGWTLEHEDLIPHGIPAPLTGVNSIDINYRYHGTRVLGVIAAADNDRGCLGIVPEIGSIKVASVKNDSLEDVLMLAIDCLSPGDVLLIELHAKDDHPPNPLMWVPVEADDAVFELIQLASSNKIVVIEAAGTQPILDGLNLDTFEVDGPGGVKSRVFDRNGGASAGFRDSGAVLVSGSQVAMNGNAHPREPHCNFGSRVDCYGLGEKVTTCDSTASSNPATKLYTDQFWGTSSGSAIIAGAALAIQGLSENNAGFRYDPPKLRSILSDPSTGTPSVNNEIGVMPDLRKISRDTLGIAPDAYMRDWIGDTGDPHNGPLSCSPDIILRTSQIGLPQTPQQVYGEGSGTENSQSLSDEADPQQDNYLYLRVRNRGAYPAANVQVKVYWATVSTLPMPSDWKLIGSSVIPNVPPGNILTVSDAITWSKNDIPGPGHYCFIALIDTPDDPAPDPAVLTDWTSFLGYVSENNNVTWRNFNVVMLQPSPPQPMALVPAGPDSQDQYAALPFEISGPAGRGFEANIEICAKLPVGSKLWLEARSPLAKQLCDESLFNLESKDGEITSVRLNPHGLNALNPILRQPGVRMPLRLQVHIPGSSDITGSYECYVRQLYKNREIGRITWRLVKPLQKKARKPKKQQKGRSRKRNLK